MDLFFPKHCEVECDISLDPAAYIMMGDYSKEIGPKPVLDIPMLFLSILYNFPEGVRMHFHVFVQKNIYHKV